MVDQQADPPAASSSTQPGQSEPTSPQAVPQPDASPGLVSVVGERTELLEKARAFLNSPQVRHEDYAAKRRFLEDKGLDEPEIDGLLKELVYPSMSAMLLDVVTRADLASTSPAHPSTNIPAATAISPPRPSTGSGEDIQLGSWGVCCAAGHLLRALSSSDVTERA